MKKRIFRFCFVYTAVIIVLTAWACNKPEPDRLPEKSTYFQIRKDGVNMRNDELRGTKFFYYDKDGNYVDGPPANLHDTSFVLLAVDKYPPGSGYDTAGIMLFRYLATEAFANGTRNFYLELPDGDVDTLVIEAASLPKSAFSVSITYMEFNGKIPKIDSTLNSLFGYVYAFEKP